MACERDFQCPDTKVCYDGVCDCAAYFGWVGDDCDAKSYQTVVYLALVYFALALAACSLVFNIAVVAKAVRAKSASGRKKWDTTSASLLFITIAVLGIVVWRLSTLTILLTPEDNRLKLLTSEEKLHRWTPVEKSAIAVSTVFTLLAAINIVVKWIDVARMSAKMLNVPEGIWGSARRKIYAFMGALVLVLIGATAGGRMVYATLAALPFMFIILAAYAYGLVIMSRLLGLLGETLTRGAPRDTGVVGPAASPRHDVSRDETAERSNSGTGGGLVGAIRKASVRLGSVRLPGSPAASGGGRRAKGRQMRNNYYELLQRVQRTAVVVGLACVWVMACLAAFSIPEITKGWKVICTPGEICYIPLVIDVLSLGMLGILGGIQVFIYENVQNQLEKDRTTGSMHPSKTSKNTGDDVQPESFSQQPDL